jgi:hypothetical protein
LVKRDIPDHGLSREFSLSSACLKLKTFESIGTINSITDQNESSLIIAPHLPTKTTDKERLDLKLSQIEEMKQVY